MGAKFRLGVVLTALLVLTAAGAAAGSLQTARRCKPARSMRCLRLARGPEPVIVSSSGRISRTDALQVFVQTVGPLPGVRAQPGAVGRSAFASASGPLRWAAAYLPTMSAAQRAAFKKLISGRAGVRARIASNPTLAAKKKWEQAGQTAVALLSQHLGVSLASPPALPVEVKLMSAPDPDGAANQGAAEPLDKNGNWANSLGPGVRCQIQIFPIAWQSSNSDLPIYVVAHEAAHCFEFKLNSPVYATLAASPWLIEGGAEWAGDQVAREVLGHDPSDPYLSGYWNGYLRFPSIGLYGRVYDAVGFFAHLAETIPGGNLWPTLRQMFKAKGSQAAYDVAVPDSNTAFLDSWASGYARDPSLGAGWDTTGVGITPSKPPIPFYAGSGNTQASMDAGPRSVAIARLQISNQVLVVSGSGGTPFGRLLDAGGSTYGLGPGAYCVTGQDCTCPSGTPGFGDSLPEIAPGAAWVALAGSNSAAHLTLTRTSTAGYCQHPIAGPPASSQLTVSGGASASSYQSGHNDSCTIHQSGAFGSPTLSCLFEMTEPGTKTIAQLSITTEHYTGPGYYHVVDRGTTTGPDVGFTDPSSTFAATWNPPADQFDAGGFTIAAVGGGMISGGISATMGDVTQPEDNPTTAGAGGTFTVPAQILP